MAFKPVNGKSNKNAKKLIGHLVRKQAVDGFYLKIDEQVDLIFKDNVTGKYYQVRKGLVKILDETKDPYCFQISINLEDEKQVELLG